MGTVQHRSFALAGALTGTALLISACGGAAGEADEAGAGESYAYGASKEEVQAAFSDVEPLTISYQTGSLSPESALGQTALAFVDAVEEWSGGKITVELHYANTVAGPTEVADAVADGRLDLAQLSPTYLPQEFPVTNSLVSASVLGSVTPLSGEIARYLTQLQTAVDTPAIHEEFESKGLVPVLPIVNSGTIGMACTEPVSSVEDLSGRLTASGSTIISKQIEAVGGMATYVDFTEIYEALQRGITNCTMSPASVYHGTGLPPVAPYYYFPEGTNFEGAVSSIIAGPSWNSLPLPAQQLLYDKSYEWLRDSNHATFRFLDLANQELVDTDGRTDYFDASVSEVLEEVNAEVIDELIATDLYDAKDYTERFEAAMAHWKAEAEAAGYTDEGSYADFGDWYKGDLSSASGEYLAEFYDAAFEEVAGAKRPA